MKLASSSLEIRQDLIRKHSGGGGWAGVYFKV